MFLSPRPRWLIALSLLLALAPAALAGGDQAAGSDDHGAGMSPGTEITEPATITYTLRTSFSAGAIGFIGVGGEIDGVLNPELQASEGDIVEITLVNGDGIEHDITLPEFDVMAEHVGAVGETSTLRFRAARSGTFAYECAIVGHREAGMHGEIVVAQGADAALE